VETSLHGALETFHAVPFSKDRGPPDSRSAFTGELRVYAGEAAAFVSLSTEYNGASPDRTGFSLGEAWLDWSAGELNVRLGRQLLSWGVADGLILTDVVCPQNLSAYAGLDFAGSRLAVDGVRLRYSFPLLAAEFLWLPLFTPARLPEDPRNPLHEIAYPASIDPGVRALPVSMAHNDPPRSIVDGEYGARLSFYTPVMDFSLSGFYGWNDVPVMGKKPLFGAVMPPVPAALELKPRYHRTLSAGADASIPLGDILLRLEAAWTGGGRYEPATDKTAAALQNGLSVEPVEKDNLKLLAGLDWNPAGWTLSVQYYEDLLPGASEGGTARRRRTNALTLRVARGLFRETLNLSAWSYLDLHDFDLAGSVSASYALSDAVSLSLGSDFFTGGIDNRGSYAAYRELSCLWIKGKLQF
jgi:hypothetical protein